MSVSIPKSLVLFTIMVLIVSIPAWASADICPAWKAANGAAHHMSVRIADNSDSALILAGDQCLAICRVKPEAPETETGRAIASISPRQIDLDCSAADFAALTGPATLIFRGVGIENPVIRFGTWLDGYRQADLKIKADRLVPARSVQRMSRGVQRKPAIAQLEVH
jgi:hypothetical protein